MHYVVLLNPRTHYDRVGAGAREGETGRGVRGMASVLASDI